MASVEGLWATEFGHAGSAFEPVNAGIVVFETGRVFGGDSWFAYTGEFDVGGDGIKGTLAVKRHHHDHGSIDAWGSGDDVFQVEFALKWLSEEVLEGVMNRDENSLGLRLKKLAELP